MSAGVIYCTKEAFNNYYYIVKAQWRDIKSSVNTDI